jgi:hypothetical protein
MRTPKFKRYIGLYSCLSFIGAQCVFCGPKRSIEGVSVHGHYVRPNEMKLHGNGKKLHNEGLNMFTFTAYCFGDEIHKQAYKLGGAGHIH